MPIVLNVNVLKFYFTEENTMEIKKTSKRILTCTLAALMLAGAAVSMPAVIPQSSLTVSAAQTYGDFEYEVKNNLVFSELFDNLPDIFSTEWNYPAYSKRQKFCPDVILSAVKDLFHESSVIGKILRRCAPQNDR